MLAVAIFRTAPNSSPLSSLSSSGAGGREVGRRNAANSRMRFAVAVATAALVVQLASGQCASGWTLYDDTAGTPPFQEGHNSCLFLLTTTSIRGLSAATKCSATNSSQPISIASTEGKSTNSLYNAAFSLMLSTWRGCGRSVRARPTGGVTGGYSVPVWSQRFQTVFLVCLFQTSLLVGAPPRCRCDCCVDWCPIWH